MGGGATAPTPPQFFPVDVPGTAQKALAADIAGFNFSDADFASRYPGLVSANNANISQTYNALTGPLDPTIQNQFVSQGISGALGSTGSGNPLATLGSHESVGGGSFGENSVAKNLSKDVMGYQDANRSAWDSITANNLPRAAGLSGGDIANLSIANSGGLSASNQANYAGQVNNANAQNAQDAANQQAALAASIAIGTALISL